MTLCFIKYAELEAKVMNNATDKLDERNNNKIKCFVARHLWGFCAALVSAQRGWQSKSIRMFTLKFFPKAINSRLMDSLIFNGL